MLQSFMSVFMTEEQRRIETGEEIKKLIRRYMADVPMSVWEKQTVKNIDKIGTITFFDNTEFTYIEKIISILLRDKDNNPFWGLTTEEKERLFCLLEKFGISCNNDDYNSVLSENKKHIIRFGYPYKQGLVPKNYDYMVYKDPLTNNTEFYGCGIFVYFEYGYFEEIYNTILAVVTRELGISQQISKWREEPSKDEDFGLQEVERFTAKDATEVYNKIKPSLPKEVLAHIYDEIKFAAEERRSTVQIDFEDPGDVVALSNDRLKNHLESMLKQDGYDVSWPSIPLTIKFDTN